MAEAFLSDGWFTQAEKIQNEVNPPVPAAIKDLKINMQVTGGPSGDVAFRMEAGKLVKGHAADAPTKLVIPFDARASAMLIDQNQQAVMSGLHVRPDPRRGRHGQADADADGRPAEPRGPEGLAADQGDDGGLSRVVGDFTGAAPRGAAPARVTGPSPSASAEAPCRP